MTETHRALMEKHAGLALANTKKWIEQFGGRLAGSTPCQKTAEALYAELSRTCDSVVIEPFVTHPTTFNNFYKLDVALYLIGLVLLFLGKPLIAGMVLLFMVCAAGLEFGFYVELYDFLFPRKTCANISAVIEARGAAKQQLIISGHHDSANELKFLRKNQKLYGLKILMPDVIRMTATVFAWAWVFHRLLYNRAPSYTPYVFGFLILGVFSVLTKFFAFSRQAVPGAGDNLIASAMVVELASLLKEQGRLEHTRVLLVSFDAEEAGLRGSRAWVKSHKQQLASLPTCALNIDSIYNAADLAFLVSDLNGHIQLDVEFARQCADLAAQDGVTAKLTPMRFIGGGTDAAELALGGVRATTMIAMPASVVRDGLVYHTMRDTVDAIQPRAVEVCLSVAVHLAQVVDRQA